MEKNYENRDRKRMRRIRSVCAWSLVLSVSAGVPPAAFAETATITVDTQAQSSESASTVGDPQAQNSATATGDTQAQSSATVTGDPQAQNSATASGEKEAQSTATTAGDNQEQISDTPLDSSDILLKDGKVPMLRSTVTETEVDHPQPTVHIGDVRVVQPGTSLDFVLSTEIEAGETKEGDEFFGKVIQDVLVDGQVVIPRGTVLHGVLSTMQEPKRAGRNGYITTRFDHLITPDGRKIQIEGNSTTRDTKGKAAAKVVGRAAGYTAVGGVVGTLIALQFGGIVGAAASHGTTLAGGAAIGGATGLTIAMLTKGKSVMLQPGAEMRVVLSEPLKLPTMTMPDEKAQDFSISGLTIKVASMRVHRHPFGELTDMTLTLDIVNETENTFSAFEVALEDELGNLLFPSPLGDTDLSKIAPGSHVTSTITFNVYNVKMHHKLVFFKPFSREPLAKLLLTDSMLANGKASSKAKHVATEARHPH